MIRIRASQMSEPKIWIAVESSVDSRATDLFSLFSRCRYNPPALSTAQQATRGFMTNLRAVYLAIVLCLYASAGLAQTVSLTGRVTDVQGGTVNGAVVTLRDAGGAGPSNDADRRRRDVCLRRRGPRFGDAAGRVAWLRALDADDVPHRDDRSARDRAADRRHRRNRGRRCAPSSKRSCRSSSSAPARACRPSPRPRSRTAATTTSRRRSRRSCPGSFWRPKSGPFDYVTASLQGSRTNEILWLVDGVRISNRLYNGTTPLDTIPAHMVERIEVLEGGQGLFYGTQAVAGVVNVVTKAFTDSPQCPAERRRQHKPGRLRERPRPRHGARQPVRGVRVDRRCRRLSDRFRARNISPARPTGIAATTCRRSAASTPTISRRSCGSARPISSPMPAASTTCSRRARAPLRVAASPKSSTSATSTSSAPSWTSRRAKTVELFFKGYYHRWDSHYSETRNVIGEPGAVEVDQREGVLGLQGLRRQPARQADAEPRLRVLRRLRFPELFGRG